MGIPRINGLIVPDHVDVASLGPKRTVVR